MSGPRCIRTLIVDDEALARQRIRDMLDGATDIEVISECSNARDAVRIILEQSPDLVFLDVEMPGMDGFGVLEELGDKPMPAVIFVTVYDQYAVKAFDVY